MAHAPRDRKRVWTGCVDGWCGNVWTECVDGYGQAVWNETVEMTSRLESFRHASTLLAWPRKLLELRLLKLLQLLPQTLHLRVSLLQQFLAD